jgi:hypothetical protein
VARRQRRHRRLHGSGGLKPMHDDIETRRGQAFRDRETESATGAGHERRSWPLRRHSVDPAVPNMSKDPTTKPKQVLSGLRHDSAEFGNNVSIHAILLP